jgi:hypothetical protein
VSLSLLKNVFLPTTAKPIKPIPSKSMVAGSGISENEKGIANVGLSEIVINAAIDIPAKNNFIIPPLFDNTDVSFEI